MGLTPPARPAAVERVSHRVRTVDWGRILSCTTETCTPGGSMPPYALQAVPRELFAIFLSLDATSCRCRGDTRSTNSMPSR